MMTPQPLERSNKAKSAWIHLVTMWGRVLGCMNVMGLEAIRSDHSGMLHGYNDVIVIM